MNDQERGEKILSKVDRRRVLCVEIAGRIWQDQEMRSEEMDHNAAMKIADILYDSIDWEAR